VSAHFEIRCDWCAADGMGTYWRSTAPLVTSRPASTHVEALRDQARERGKWARIGKRDACPSHARLASQGKLGEPGK
jgi:hypothetical protein